MKFSFKLFLLVVGLAFTQTASAFIANINAGTRSVYLRVGDGAYTGLGNANGTPGNLATVNLVSVTVPAAAVGNNTPQLMSSSATQNTSFYDNYVFCNLPNQVYIGGFFRRPTLGGGANTAILSATSPANLVNADGDTIPFSEISWTSSGNSEASNVAQPVPAGTFTGGSQTLANYPVNTWRESCHTFRYANSDYIPAGVYRGRVTYTLVVP